MPRKYQIKSLFWLVKDEAGVKFHLASDDYFGTIATVLSLIRQQMKKDGRSETAVFKKTLHNIETDLLYLQKNYQIKARPKANLKSEIRKRARKAD